MELREESRDEPLDCDDRTDRLREDSAETGGDHDSSLTDEPYRAAYLAAPIATSPGRSGFGPQLSLSYDSGAGNGPFGFG